MGPWPMQLVVVSAVGLAGWSFRTSLSLEQAVVPRVRAAAMASQLLSL